MELFPDEGSAEAWFIRQRWPTGVCCTKCGGLNTQKRKTRKPQPFRCRVPQGLLGEDGHPLVVRVFLNDSSLCRTQAHYRHQGGKNRIAHWHAQHVSGTQRCRAMDTSTQGLCFSPAYLPQRWERPFAGKQLLHSAGSPARASLLTKSSGSIEYMLRLSSA